MPTNKKPKLTGCQQLAQLVTTPGFLPRTICVFVVDTETEDVQGYGRGRNMPNARAILGAFYGQEANPSWVEIARQQLASTPAIEPAPAKRKGPSVAARKKMAAATKQRWAKFRAEQAAAARKVVAKAPTKAMAKKKAPVKATARKATPRARARKATAKKTAPKTMAAGAAAVA